MPASSSHQTPLTLLSAFVRALAHKVRTPLSVITNDLTYLRTLVPPEECERSLERSREIANLLRRLCDGCDADLDLRPLTLSAVLPPNLASLSECTVVGDEQKLRLAFEFLNEVLFSLGRGAIDAVGTVTPECTNLEIRHVMDGARPELDGRRFECFTALVNIALERDTPFPPLLDALLLAHGCAIEISVDGSKISIGLRFPRPSVA